jgi:polygalacturonase
MKKKNIVKRAGNGIFLTVTLVSMLVASSCKKDAPVTPDNNSSTQLKTQSNPAAAANKPSQPITLNGAHDITISGYTINGGSASCIDMANCYNIHITNCKLINSDKLGVNLSNCHNVVIDSCQIDNVSAGIYSLNGTNVQVKDNKIGSLTGQGKVSFAFENAGITTDDTRSNSAINNELGQ